ncbi:BZ3500_MvSof-1268-A1-R1_Chr9g10541 [Microbotryum saponariae]|uniref:BZ3500_MvSof-1268-A1-R1_Chr9g10541 protein n=1 Tax=Microbotryum saponariae TaxID=289078 RepID=A0A2X0KA85_9BASI|nr:BZ3501_MvSof-1269-A2-R1_Chr9g10290 [Microbotryum saponariae]SDA00265.1 BZ3500_MvSof-1268-A1-R1_Chr9g10541 [Microbotryum saponariae]
MATLPRMYRATLRQFVANSIHPRVERSASIPQHLRLIFDEAKSLSRGSKEAKAFERQVEDMVIFLQAHRSHKALVERYNPSSGMTEDEKAHKSARMVGLEFPEAFEAGVEPTMERQKAKQIEKREQQAKAQQ